MKSLRSVGQSQTVSVTICVVKKRVRKWKILPSVSLIASYNALRVVFIYCDILSLSLHVGTLFCYSPCSLCESTALSSHFFNKLSPWFSLVGFYVDGLPLFSALSPSQYRLAALFSVLSLSFHVIFPVYLLSNFNLLRSRILFFFLLAGAHCPDTYSNRPVFITWRSKVWAKHWLFWWWEQNGMDFHLYSKMWLQQYVRVFIRRGQEVIHHSATWEH